MKMKEVAKKLPEQLAAANSSSIIGNIDQMKLIGAIAAAVIVLLLLYACGAA